MDRPPARTGPAISSHRARSYPVSLVSTRVDQLILCCVLLLQLYLIMSAVGCSVILAPDYSMIAPDVDSLQVGSCMCAICWDRPFCYHEESGRHSLPDAMGNCPSIIIDMAAVPTVLAVPASRLRQGDTRQGFFCIPPPGGDVNYDQEACPADDIARAALEHVDPCTDVPTECRDPDDPEFARCSPLAAPPGAPACPEGYQTGTRQTGCAATSADARSKVIAACSLGNLSEFPPSGARPSRYCFLSCATNTGIPEMTCEDTIFDPPEITSGAYFWELTGTGSSATIIYGTEEVSVPLEGSIALSAPRCDPGETCIVEVPWLRGEAATDFDIAGYSYTNTIILNPMPIAGGTVTPLTGSKSLIEIPSGSSVFISSNPGWATVRQAYEFVSSDRILGTIDWTTRAIELHGSFYDEELDATVKLDIYGLFPNRAPQAEAGPDLVQECTSSSGAWVTLSAAASTDPDSTQGSSDIESYAWASVTAPNYPSPVPYIGSSGLTTAVHVGIETRLFSLTVTDASNVMSSDVVKVTVRDTSPPSFNSGLLPTCIPSDGQMRLFRPSDLLPAFSDTCDPSLELDVLSVTTNVADMHVASPDIVFGAHNFCIRGERDPPSYGQRRYYATVRASDGSGNETIKTIQITVPSSSCPKFYSVPLTGAGDPQCTQ